MESQSGAASKDLQTAHASLSSIRAQVKAKQDEIKKAYRKLALTYHPDKHATGGEDAKKAAVLKFQQVGVAYAVLGDEKRREKKERRGRCLKKGQ